MCARRKHANTAEEPSVMTVQIPWKEKEMEGSMTTENRSGVHTYIHIFICCQTRQLYLPLASKFFRVTSAAQANASGIYVDIYHLYLSILP